MFSVFPTPFTSLAPIPPTPMQAMLSLSLGAVKPRPSTWRGTMVKATPAPTSPTNLRLEMRLRAMRRSPLIGRHGLGRARASGAKEHCEQEQSRRRDPGGQPPEAGPAVERETGSAAKHPVVPVPRHLRADEHSDAVGDQHEEALRLAAPRGGRCRPE